MTEEFFGLVEKRLIRNGNRQRFISSVVVRIVIEELFFEEREGNPKLEKSLDRLIQKKEFEITMKKIKKE